MEYHEYANLFPMMPRDDLKRLAEDIAEKGLAEPIVTYQGKILDGRNRYEACVSMQIDPRFEEYEGRDALGFVISHNLHRRHLSESQRGLVAASIASLPHGGNRGNQHTGGKGSIDLLPTQKQAAEMLNVSVPTVKRSKEVLAKGVPELVEKQRSGEISASAAQAIARLPKEEQPLAIEARDAPREPERPTMPKGPIRPSDAMGIFVVAKSHMEKIRSNDLQRAQALQSMMNYCEERMEENK